ncbi:MAG: acyltransferase [Planctomycetaceae bacterium]|nr:acyltransferase [Planctomycetaceae bacterium]
MTSDSLFNPGYYTESELKSAGFRSVGSNVRIAKNNTIVGLNNISVGNNVRIDGYCGIIANGPGVLMIGSNVHIGGWCFLAAAEGITISDFAGLSQGVKIYSRSDDYTGDYLTNPTVPEILRGGKRGSVFLGKHVIVGAGTVILPDLVIPEGCAVGAQSLVTKNLKPWGIYFGSPVRRLRNRSTRLLQLEGQLP